MNIGYACINTELSNQKITTNRGMKKSTFIAKGLSYVSELALANVRDLHKVIQWNVSKDIKVFRISSDLFPWMSEYNFQDLPDWNNILIVLDQIGKLALNSNMRLSFHPGPFNILCSPREDVVNNTINELNKHSLILDLMGLPCNQTHKVNIHIGGAYGDKNSAIERWISNFKKLSLSTKSRLTIENDDKPNMYSVEDLLYVSESTGVPIVFDFHHYDCHPGTMTKEQSLRYSLQTWPSGIVPMTHYSSSKKNYEDSTVKKVAHADYLYDQIPFVNNFIFDVVLEAKAKEQALLKYKLEFTNG